jgi:hypothetical protein
VYYVDDEVSRKDPQYLACAVQSRFQPDEACEWLQKQIARDLKRIVADEDSTAFEKLMLDTRNRMRHWISTVRLFMPDWETLTVSGKENGKARMVCPPSRRNPIIVVKRAQGSDLDRLAKLVDLIVRMTPFEEHLVVWWILTGKPPVLPPMRVVERVRQIPTLSGDITFSWVETQIFVPDLKFLEYRNAGFEETGLSRCGSR